MKWKITLVFFLMSFISKSQEIDIVRASSIANNGTYDFGNVVTGITSTVTFTIHNTANLTTLNLSGPPIVDVDGPDASMFTVNESATALVLTNISSTTFTVTFSPTSPGIKTANFTISSNDADEGTYVINLTGTGTVNNLSSILFTPAYTYPQNIAYQNYQTPNITNSVNDIEIASFTIRDGNGAADTDNLPTVLTDITFSLSNPSNIRSLAIYDGLTEIAEEDGASSITFNSLNLIASDNGTKIFTIRVSYNDLNVVDNSQNMVAVAAATASSTSSVFNTANAGGAATSNASNNNRVEVTATKLLFVQDSNTVDTFVVMSPALTVEAVDAFNNRDLDYTAVVFLGTTGTYSTSPSPVPTNDPSNNAVAGLATFPSIVHGVAGTGLTLTATSGALTSAVSNPFDIAAASAVNNYFRSRTSGNWNAASSWESSGDNVIWATATAAPTVASRGIRILNGHTITCTSPNTGDQMVVDNGGIFILDTGANFTLNNGAGTDLTLNGTFTFNGGTFNQVASTITVGGTGIYNHTATSSTLTLPVATWGNNSTCNITGMNNATDIVATNMNQSFSNLNWNNQNQVGIVSINSSTFRVRNILNIGNVSTNANNALCLASDSGTYTNTLTTTNVVSGKLIASIGSGNSTISLAGTTTISGGEFVGSQGMGVATINAATTFNLNGGQFILINNVASGNVNFTVTPTNRDMFIIGTGALLLEKVSSASGVATVTLNRSLTVSSTAVPAIDFGTGTVTDNAINIRASLTKTLGGTFTTTSATAAKGFVFFNTGTGAHTLNYSGTDSSSVNYTVNANSTLTLGSNLTLVSSPSVESIFTVLSGGRLTMGTRSIIGNATNSRVNINSGAILASANTNGLGGTGITGSFQGFGSVDVTPATGRLCLPAGINYILSGVTTTPFPVGPSIVFGNPATVTTSVNITSNMTTPLTVTSSFTVSANTFRLNSVAGNNLILDGAALNIIGAFDNNGENQVLGSGVSPSINVTGRFITRDAQGFVGTGAAIPVIVPTLNAASTVEYALAGNQVVQGSPAYVNLTFSGSGTKTLDSNTAVSNRITIMAATFDTQAFTAGGPTTALNMTGGIYRTSAATPSPGSTIKPDAGGTYTLASASTIEFYGANPIEIRLGSPLIKYGRIIVSGTDVSNNSTTTGIEFVSTSASFTVKNGAIFKFKNTAGFTGSTSTALSNVVIINPILEAAVSPLISSTIEYAGANQTVTPYNIGTTTSYKKVKISGTGVKTLSSDVLIREDLNVTASLLKIENSRTLTVTNGVTTVNTTATDGLLIENNGSLVQVTAVDNLITNVNVGNINMQRTTQSMYRYDFTYWGSPVKNFTLNSLSPLTLSDKYMWWNATTSAWVVSLNGVETMVAGKGYAVRAPQTFSLNPAIKIPYQATFVGIPNNGTVTYAINGNGALTPARYNLLSNPYPSAIDIHSFLISNNTKVDGTVYLWTHTTPVSGTSYSSSDYATYNLTGSTGTATGGASRYLAAGQGFFIKGISTGANTVTFTNAMRLAGNNTNFLKPALTTPVENWETTGLHRVWLNLTNTQGAFNQTLVGYAENATDALDWGYDGEHFGGNYVGLYSMVDNKNLAIQGKALPFSNQDEVPLGYSTTLTGELSISIDHFDGLFEGQDIYLKDNLLNIVHDLKAADYTFSTVPGTFNERFVLRYLPGETLETTDHQNIANGVMIYKENNQIIVTSTLESIQEIIVYDLLGRIIFETKKINANSYSIADVVLNTQGLIIKTKLANGQIVNKKIIY